MTNTEQSREAFEVCPFCGAQPEYIVHGREDYVCCTNNACQAQPSTIASKWNSSLQSRQPEIDALKAQVKHLENIHLTEIILTQENDALKAKVEELQGLLRTSLALMDSDTDKIAKLSARIAELEDPMTDSASDHKFEQF